MARPRSLPRPAAAERRRRRCAGRAAEAGFTLVEMVVVMLLLAIVSSIGAARFADRDAFAVQGAADQLVAGLRLAQATAVARRQSVHVVLGAAPATLVVCLDAGCAQPLATPAGDSTWLADAGDLQLGAGATFAFQPDGSPTLASQLLVQVRNVAGTVMSPAIRVEPISGHVHTP